MIDLFTGNKDIVGIALGFHRCPAVPITLADGARLLETVLAEFSTVRNLTYVHSFFQVAR